jgi:hypothetical protein
VLWIIVFGSIALVGLLVLVCYGVWLSHKTADVISEVAVLTDRSGQLIHLVGQIQVPQSGLGADPAASPRTVPDRLDPRQDDVR